MIDAKRNIGLELKKKPDIAIFEGWCIGAKPQSNNSLIKPLNELERKKDKKLIWRRTVNNELKNNYKKIFKMIDFLIFIKIPNFKYIYKWRSLQEKKLRKSSKGKKIMSNLNIKEFIMHYERVTKYMLKTLNKTSNLLINLNKEHCFKSIKLN